MDGPRFKLDQDRGIIAAGPVTEVDCGHFGTSYRRVVMVWRPGSKWRPQGHYETAVEELDYQTDAHVQLLDEVEYETYKLAAAAFLRRCGEFFAGSVGYHDHD